MSHIEMRFCTLSTCVLFCHIEHRQHLGQYESHGIGDTGLFVRESYTKLVEKHDFSGKGTAFGPYSHYRLGKINIL